MPPRTISQSQPEIPLKRSRTHILHASRTAFYLCLQREHRPRNASDASEEQLNGVKTVRPVSLSRLIAVSFFVLVPPLPRRRSTFFEDSAQNSSLFIPNKTACCSLRRGRRLISQTRLCSGDILIVVSKQRSPRDAGILRQPREI